MKMLKQLLAAFLGIWAILVFAITLSIIAFPVWLISFMKEPKRTHYAFKLFNPWLKCFFVLSGVKRIYKGRQHFKKGENYVVVCNHNSFMDVPLCSPGIPEPNKTIAKIEMSRIPIFGVIYKGGSVLVDRKDPDSRQKSYNRMKEILEMGLHMCIYPEGTRNKTNEPLQKFQDGAFRLAVETGKKIIPALIFNTKKVLPNDKKFYFWPHTIEMHFLPPVEVENKSTEELKNEVYGLMKDYYIKYQ